MEFILEKVYHNDGADEKTGYADSPRSPPSIALGLWTNPSATEPGPVGLELRQTPKSGRRFLAVSQLFLLAVPGLKRPYGASGLGCGEGSGSRIAPAASGASRVFKNCLSKKAENQKKHCIFLILLHFFNYYPALGVSNIFIPWRARRVIKPWGSTGCPGTTRRVKCCARVASKMVASASANAAPIQIRLPPPNGR
jgi:hypothetical protein